MPDDTESHPDWPSVSSDMTVGDRLWFAVLIAVIAAPWITGIVTLARWVF